MENFTELFRLAKVALDNNMVEDPVTMLTWITLLSANEQTNTGRIYKSLYFALIPDVKEAIDPLLESDLINENAYVLNSPKSDSYLVCYDIVGGIGVPVVSIKGPYFDINSDSAAQILDNVIKIYETLNSSSGDTYEVV